MKKTRRLHCRVGGGRSVERSNVVLSALYFLRYFGSSKSWEKLSISENVVLVGEMTEAADSDSGGDVFVQLNTRAKRSLPAVPRRQKRPKLTDFEFILAPFVIVLLFDGSSIDTCRPNLLGVRSTCSLGKWDNNIRRDQGWPSVRTVDAETATRCGSLLCRFGLAPAFLFDTGKGEYLGGHKQADRLERERVLDAFGGLPMGHAARAEASSCFHLVHFLLL